MSELEERINTFLRKGAVDKAEYIKKLRGRLLDSQIARIKRQDRTILKEIVLPKWFDWDLLYLWAQEQEISEGDKKCILCLSENGFGIIFNGHFICEKCFMGLKEL